MPTATLTPEDVTAIAQEVERRAPDVEGLAGVGERKHLEPAAVAALGKPFPGRVEKDRKVEVPHWTDVGRADLIVRAAPGSERLHLLAELKWCGPNHDLLYEAVWDMIKLALATTRTDSPSAYLITGAELVIWRGSNFADLFDDGEHDPLNLCLRELRDSRCTPAWDALLEGGYDRYPDAVPESLRTTACARARVGEWELRAVAVSVGGEGLIPMGGGWPYGQRPAHARRPADARRTTT